MIRNGRLRPLALALTLIALLAHLTGPARAERADRDMPTNIESDRMQYDDAKKVTVFTGNVVLSKGTINVQGDRLVLQQRDDGTQTAIATGKRASFRQKREGMEQIIHGVANEINYDSGKEIVRLTGNALIRRLECEVAIDEISGGVVVYNARTEQFTVDGKDPGSNKGRVRIVIQPRPHEGSGSAGKPAADKPAACPPAAAVPLQPATGLGTPREGAAAR